MALSKNYTLKTVSDIARVLVNQIAPDKVQTLTVTDYVNLSVNDVAEMLNGANAPFYGAVHTGSVVGAQMDLSTLHIDRIVKVTDSLNGLIPPVGDYAFENLSGITAYASSVFFQHFGERLNLFKGANISAFGNEYVHYYRQPTAVTGSAEYLDIPDKYVPLVIAKIKNYVYEQVGQQAPEGLTSLIESKTAAIRDTHMSELSALQSRQKPQTGTNVQA
jgi:hypothetical protein